MDSYALLSTMRSFVYMQFVGHTGTQQLSCDFTSCTMLRAFNGWCQTSGFYASEKPLFSPRKETKLLELSDIKPGISSSVIYGI